MVLFVLASQARAEDETLKRNVAIKFLFIKGTRNPQELIDQYTPSRVEEWLEQNGDERFFLFLHTYTVHDFDPPPEFIDADGRIDPMPYMHHEYVRKHGIDEQVIADIDAYYDGALRYVDGLVGKLRRKLLDLGLAKNTILVITSDHGEDLM